MKDQVRAYTGVFLWWTVFAGLGCLLAVCSTHSMRTTPQESDSYYFTQVLGLVMVIGACFGCNYCGWQMAYHNYKTRISQ